MKSVGSFNKVEKFENEHYRRTHVLGIASGVGIIVLSIFLLYYSIFDRTYNIVPMAILWIVTLYSYILNKRGRTESASHILVWSMLIGLLSLASVNDGVYDSSLQGVPAVLIVAALVFEKHRDLIIVSILCILSVIVIGILQTSDLLLMPKYSQKPISLMFDTVFIESTTVILVIMVFSYLKESLNRELAEKQALLRSEERFKLSMEATNDGLWDWNIVTDEGYFSPAYYTMLGYDPGTFAAEGRVWKDLIHPEDREYTTRVNTECIEGSRETFEVEYRMKAKDGEYRWILGRGKCITRDEHGRALRLVGTHVDITERRMTEQLVRDMQRRESIGILSSGIAHDFNNLLGAMMGNITLAQSHLLDHHPAMKNIEKALFAMERATGLTRQMLAYSGKGKFQICTIDVGNVIEDHVSLFSVSLPKNVTLRTHIHTASVYVNGDPGQIEQVVMNLIINGGEAIGSEQGSVTITLSECVMNEHALLPYRLHTSAPLSGGSYALLEVTDTGSGMSQETVSKIFDPFFTTKFTGRGLGLSAVIGIVQGHKGGMTVESTEGKGTTFRIVLPAVPPPVLIEDVVPGEKILPVAAKKTILVIDDEQDVATTAQEMLETGNYSTYMELNPVLGIECYTRHRAVIGAVLLDMTMPEMSGKQVVEALQAIDADVRIIISSGYSHDEMTRQMGKANVSGYIQKPYRLQSLLKVVQSVMA